MFALVDCNNFFVSCERVFNPKLRRVPVVVLSNNDGCIISRSGEAKALGIPMGAPYFKVRDQLERHNVRVFSSNFQLYGDMSGRVMRVLERFGEVETYSIDEAFLPLAMKDAGELRVHACAIQSTIRQWTGIPVSVGIAPTKTLAKLAAEIAKKGEGVKLLTDEGERECVLRDTPVEDIWGIGRNLSLTLRLSGINTAWELAQAHDGHLRKAFNVMMVRKSWELRGISCAQDDSVPQYKKAIISSRSFGQAITNLPELKEAAASFTAKAARKLRAQGSLAGAMVVGVRGGKYDEKPHYLQALLEFPVPTDDTAELIRYAHQAAERMFNSGRRYKKCSVMLTSFTAKGHEQHTLFHTSTPEEIARRARLHRALDGLQSRFGEQAVMYGAQGLHPQWRGKSDRCSPRYTTRWEELLTVK